MEGGNGRQEDQFDYLFKIVLIGDTNVGKSNLLSRLTANEFLANSKPTIGVEFGTKTFNFEDARVKAQIWDTAGQERYRAIITSYYRGACGGIVVYDVTNRSSFEHAFSVWIPELRGAAGPSTPAVLVGNKTDLKSYREVPYEEARTKAMEAGLGFYETSALTGENVASTFEIFTKEIYEEQKKSAKIQEKAKVRREDLIGQRIKEDIEKSKRKSGCC